MGRGTEDAGPRLPQRLTTVVSAEPRGPLQWGHVSQVWASGWSRPRVQKQPSPLCGVSEEQVWLFHALVPAMLEPPGGEEPSPLTAQGGRVV